MKIHHFITMRNMFILGYKYSKLTKIHKRKEAFSDTYESPTWLTRVLAQFGFFILLFVGFLNEMLFPPQSRIPKNRKDYQPPYDSFMMFYIRYVMYRILDCFDNAICGNPGREILVRNRVQKENSSRYYLSGPESKRLNLASYDYLGFAEAAGYCADNAINSIHKYGVTTGNTRLQNGTCALHDDLEKLLSEFLGMEDSIAFGMGFATNSLTIPAFLPPGCLVLSDEKNHSSMIVGFKLANVAVKIFNHNNHRHLEQLLKESIYYGQPNQENNKYKPWKKIVIFVEGIYSMEGTICNLPEIIALKKKYKAYLYLDEAHSIGAMGSHGRGIVDFHNCDPKDVDILMGTFTKSFAAAGGYIAGTKELINFFREQTYASRYCWAIAPPVVAQIISAINIVMGKDGTNDGKNRIDRLARNTRYFRARLQQMGLIIYGNNESPVIPIMVYYCSKAMCLVRRLREEKIAVVPVIYPGTPLTEARVRICLSAGHTKKQLDYALQVIEKLSYELGLKYSRIPRKKATIIWHE